MSKKALKLGAASILALGAGAAVVSKKNKRNEQRKVTKDIQKKEHMRSSVILKEGNILRTVRDILL